MRFRLGESGIGKPPVPVTVDFDKDGSVRIVVHARMNLRSATHRRSPTVLVLDPAPVSRNRRDPETKGRV